MTPRPAGTSGAVLLVVVLLALALLGLAHGLLVSAELAYVTSAAHAETVELDALGEGRLEAELRGGWEAWMDSVAVGGTRPRPPEVQGGSTTWSRWRRLGLEAWLVRSSASRGSRAPVELRRLVWLPNPGARVAALPGVVSVGPAAPVSIQGAVLADTVPALGVVTDAALGLLELDRLVALGDSLGPVGTPAPVDLAGVCRRSDVWNWGDPLRPSRPCGAHHALVGRDGDLTVAGGEGQGLLVVDGDVIMTAGASFQGLLLATGRLELRDASAIEGRVLALGGVSVDPTSRVVGSPARAEQALAATRDRLGGALPLHGAPRLGPG